SCHQAAHPKPSRQRRQLLRRGRETEAGRSRPRHWAVNAGESLERMRGQRRAPYLFEAHRKTQSAGLAGELVSGGPLKLGHDEAVLPQVVRGMKFELPLPRARKLDDADPSAALEHLKHDQAAVAEWQVQVAPVADHCFGQYD